ncbi:MAG TPA: class I adenylate-forming enzyme family protein [Tepidisphaeraceae bacterium]|nr:class I adenylate-forming enzyme family protein [Tepidisphaeraceae bacterium]
MTLQLCDQLNLHARTRPDATAACRAGGEAPEALTFSDLAARVSAIAATAEFGQPAGVVLLRYPNRPEFLAGFFGVLAAGGTVFPIAAGSTVPETTSAAARSGAAAAIVARSDAPLLQSSFRQSRAFPEFSGDAMLLFDPVWTARTADGPALLLQSSGTTGTPKIVRRDGASLDAVARAMVNGCGFSAADHVLAGVPLCHSYGMEHGVLAPVWAGSCVHVLERFDLAAAIGELRAGGITMLPGVPFMFEMLSRATGPFPTLRRVYSAGGPLPRSTFDSFVTAFGLRIGQVYGATEIGSVTFNNPDDPEFDPASVGAALEGVTVRILDADDPHVARPLPTGNRGQVAIAAQSMLSGYVDGEPPPLLEGHYLTGDLGVLDARGRLAITGRLNLLIDIGGRKVNPAEVENVLRLHPGVGACVVIPMRLSETVCRLKAIVTPRPVDVPISAEELRRFARERLSGYKVPRIFEVRDALPTSPSGKVLRRRVEA